MIDHSPNDATFYQLSFRSFQDKAESLRQILLILSRNKQAREESHNKMQCMQQ